MVWTLYMVQVDLFRVQMDLFWAKNDILGQIWLKKWKMFRIHKDIRFPGGIFLACLDGNSLRIIWTCFRFQMDQFRVQNCMLCPILLKMWNSADADGGPRSRVCSRDTPAQPPIDVSGNFSAHVSAE